MAASKRKTTSTAKDRYTAPALEKGLDIVELLADETEGLNLSDIGEKLNRSVGEIFRMLAVLERRGYIAVVPGSDRYALTLKMFELSHRHAPVKRLVSAAANLMEKLAAELEQSCHLVIYYQGRGLVIAVRESPAESGFSVRLGSEVGLIDNCSGHVLLAYADDDKRQQMLDARPEYLKKRLSKAKLQEIVTRVQSLGYESMDSTITQGIKDVGYPIFDYTGAVVAALTIPFLGRNDNSHPVSYKDAIQRLGAVALQISRSLGYLG